MPDAHDDSLRPKSVLRRLRWHGEYLFVAGWALGLRLLPRRAALIWGTTPGFLAYFALRADRRVAMANLDIVFGERRSIGFKRELALQTFQRLGELVMGLLWAPRLTPRSAAYCVDTRGLCEILHRLEGESRGAVIVTPHYGDWELGCIATAYAGYPVLSVAQPLANPRLDRLFTQCRTCSGNRVIAPRYALLKLVRALRAGQRVAILCDVNGLRGRGGVWNDFFGLKVFNGVGMAELALRTRSPIIFVAVEPTTAGRHRIRPTLLEVIPTSDHAGDVRRVTQQVTDMVTEQLRRCPGPWLWTYKRWKRRPSPEQDAYPFYSNYKRVEANPDQRAGGMSVK